MRMHIQTLPYFAKDEGLPSRRGVVDRCSGVLQIESPAVACG
jgi:hypothetical protein